MNLLRIIGYDYVESRILSNILNTMLIWYPLSSVIAKGPLRFYSNLALAVLTVI